MDGLLQGLENFPEDGEEDRETGGVRDTVAEHRLDLEQTDPLSFSHGPEGAVETYGLLRLRVWP